MDRPGELRPANPPLQQPNPLSVRAWMRQQLGQEAPREPGPLLPPTVRQYLQQENRIEARIAAMQGAAQPKQLPGTR